MRRIKRSEFKRLMNSNVCEIFFLRRRPERSPGRPLFRQMICTNSREILRSENGIRSLNFKPPTGPPQINESKHNIVVSWDIIMQDYRNVSMENCYLIQTIPADDRFWQYYNDVLLKMSGNEKLRYMDGVENLPLA